MKLGRKKLDLKWNYGVQFEQSYMRLEAYMLSIWLFRIKKLPEDFSSVAYYRKDVKGFMIDIEFGLSYKVYSFRLPRIRGRIM